MPNEDSIEQEDTEERETPELPPEPEFASLPNPEPAPVLSPPDSKWSWIGSPARPEAEESSDGISDLFEVGDDLTDTQDLVSVDIERDILDAGPEGDLSDLVEVSEEDILGDEETGQVPLNYKPDPLRRKPATRPRRFFPRYIPPSSAGGMRRGLDV